MVLVTSTPFVPKRPTWANGFEFILSCIGWAVGLGNVWRFPYLCYSNGGGAFLIAYLIMVVLMALPLFLLELVIGQYGGMGPLHTFSRLVPIFSGLGFSNLIVMFFISIYYQVIIAWSFLYLFVSFSSDLEWGNCHHEYNTPGCYSSDAEAICNDTQIFYNFNCTNLDDLCSWFDMSANMSYCYNDTGHYHISRLITRVLASEEYYKEGVLGIGDSTWENFGSLRWQILLCLLLSWTITCLCVIKGVKSFGKTVYFTALFPYVILTALVVRGVTLEGAADGIRHYLLPDWQKLLDIEMWANAASQTFYAFSFACGAIITLASYSSFGNNCLNDCLIVSAINCFTSLYAGFAVFSILGFLALQLDVPIEDVATQGSGLAFVVYPEAILRLPLPQLWAVLFFLMMVILGLGTMFAGVEAVCTAIVDQWVSLRRLRWLVTIGVCCFGFLLGIPMCFSGGIYLFSLVEWNTASWSIMLICMVELIAVTWIFGAARFMGCMQEMGIKLSKFSYWFWRSAFVVVTPAVCFALSIFQIVSFTDASYEEYTFPGWATALGYMISVTTLLPIPLLIGILFFVKGYRGWEWFKPLASWGSQQSPKSEPPQTKKEILANLPEQSFS